MGIRKIDSRELTKLPPAVKALIRDGVYSLYTIADPKDHFFLTTDEDKSYILDSVGGEAQFIGSFVIDFEEPVMFSDEPSPEELRVTIDFNY